MADNDIRATVLVTGGAGYIGSHVCRALSDAGYLPVTYDNLSNGHRWAVKWGPIEIGNILDGHRLQEAIARWRPSAVMHLAALIEVAESIRHPSRFRETNVDGTLVLLDALRASGLDRMVFSSSAAVYGPATHAPITEAQECAPSSPYGVHKLAIEQRLIDFARDRGLRSVSLRYFNAAGADVDAGIGEAHDPETHLIPRVLDVALGRRSAVEIFGVNYPTPDGTCIRDFIHVCDIADAHLLALKMLERRSGAHRFNLGTGTGYSVKQVIECARATTEHKLPIVVRPPRPGDPPMLVSDGTLACAELGWRPWRSTLAEQTRDAWRWHRGHFGMA